MCIYVIYHKTPVLIFCLDGPHSSLETFVFFCTALKQRMYQFVISILWVMFRCMQFWIEKRTFKILKQNQALNFVELLQTMLCNAYFIFLVCFYRHFIRICSETVISNTVVSQTFNTLQESHWIYHSNYIDNYHNTTKENFPSRMYFFCSSKDLVLAVNC